MDASCRCMANQNRFSKTIRWVSKEARVCWRYSQSSIQSSAKFRSSSTPIERVESPDSGDFVFVKRSGRGGTLVSQKIIWEQEKQKRSGRYKNKTPRPRGARCRYGRDGRIRTDDFCVPNAALYQAELHPVRLHNRRANHLTAFYYTTSGNPLQLAAGRLKLCQAML